MSNTSEGRVTVTEDVVFGRGGDRDLACDVYTPPGNPINAPAVLLIHGGAWVVGDRKQLKGYGFLLGREGFVCVACEYRLAGEARWPAQLHDVKAAIRWMRANADELGIDPGRISLSGASAGGHLALIAGGAPDASGELEGDGGNAGVSSAVAAVVAYYAPSKLSPGGAMLAAPTAKLMGPDADEDDFAAASPLTYARAGFPPTMLLQSNLDELVPRTESLNLCNALHAAGVPVELHLYDGAPHMFDGHPGLARQSVQLIKLFLERYVPESATEA